MILVKCDRLMYFKVSPVTYQAGSLVPIVIAQCGGALCSTSC